MMSPMKHFVRRQLFRTRHTSRLACDAFPSIIQIQTTSRCNGRCSFCPYSDLEDTLSHGTMDVTLFRTIVDESAAKGAKLIYPFLMNEPFVDYRILDRIEYIRSKGLSVELSTNGSLLSQQKADALCELGIKGVVFNFPSIDEDEFRKSMPGVDRSVAIENILYLASVAPKAMYVTVQVNAQPDVESENIDRTVDFFVSRGVDVRVREAMDRAGNLAEEGLAQHIYVEKLRGCYIGAHRRHAWILWNGDCVLCCQDWRRTVVLGNVAQCSIEDVWWGERYVKIRRSVEGLISSGSLLCHSCEFAIEGFSFDSISRRHTSRPQGT